jgi:hypothetical protein
MANLWLRCQSRNAQGSKVILGLVGNIRCLWPPPGYYGPGPGYDVPHRDMAAPVLATAALAPDMPAPVLETALAPDMPAPVPETPALAPILTMAACQAIALISTTILPELGSATNSPDHSHYSSIRRLVRLSVAQNAFENSEAQLMYVFAPEIHVVPNSAIFKRRGCHVSVRLSIQRSPCCDSHCNGTFAIESTNAAQAKGGDQGLCSAVATTTRAISGLSRQTPLEYQNPQGQTLEPSRNRLSCGRPSAAPAPLNRK